MGYFSGWFPSLPGKNKHLREWTLAPDFLFMTLFNKGCHLISKYGNTLLRIYLSQRSFSWKSPIPCFQETFSNWLSLQTKSLCLGYLPFHSKIQSWWSLWEHRTSKALTCDIVPTCGLICKSNQSYNMLSHPFWSLKV